MELRSGRPQDCPAMARLFYETVHAVNSRDYAPGQLDAWAPGQVDLEAWRERFAQSVTLVAEEDGALAGFANMTSDGYLDMLYVHKDRQGRGIATALCRALERRVEARRYTVHASITARPFFEKRGYRVVREQWAERRGERLTQYSMEKPVPELIMRGWTELAGEERETALAGLPGLGFVPRGGWAALRREMDASRAGALPQYLLGFAEGTLCAYLFLYGETGMWAAGNPDELPARQAQALLRRGAALCRDCGAERLAARLEETLP